MNINQFREIMKDIDNNTEGDAVKLRFYTIMGFVFVGTWEWLGDPKEWVADNEVIVVSVLDAPPTYVPIANITAIEVSQG